MLIQLEGDMIKDIAFNIDKNDPEQMSVYEFICWEELEWLLENNVGRYYINYKYTLEVGDDSERRSRES